MQQLQAIRKDAVNLVSTLSADSAKLGDRAPYIQTLRMAASDCGLTGANADALTDAIESVHKARSKDKAVKAAASLRSLVTDLCRTPEGEDTAPKPELSLKQLTGRIKTQLKAAQDSSRKAGAMLADAKGHFDSSGDWLAWAESEFGLKKAHVYRLVKIAETFGDNPAFDGVDAHALRILIDGKTDAEKMEEAERMAERGELNPQSARQLLGDDDKQKQRKAERDEESAQVLEQNRQLAKQCKDLSAAVEELREQLAAERKAKEKVSTLDTLPQFHSDLMHIRLGLTEQQGQDVKQVRAAYRALAKYWNEESNAEAFALITEAADSLRFPK